MAVASGTPGEFNASVVDEPGQRQLVERNLAADILSRARRDPGLNLAVRDLAANIQERRVALRPNVTCAFTGTGGETPAPSPSSRRNGVISLVSISAAPLSTTSSSAVSVNGRAVVTFDAADISFERDVELSGTQADAAQGDP